jgi:hypothetical protein
MGQAKPEIGERMPLDPEAVRSALASRLPLAARWMINETPMDYDFSAARRVLQPLDRDALLDAPEAEWLDLLIFGEYDYAEGGGANPFLGVMRATGAIHGLDVERDDQPLFLLNSSTDAFIETFTFLNSFLGAGRPLPTDADARLRSIDPHAYPDSDWKRLVEYIASEAG